MNEEMVAVLKEMRDELRALNSNFEKLNNYFDKMRSSGPQNQQVNELTNLATNLLKGFIPTGGK